MSNISQVKLEGEDSLEFNNGTSNRWLVNTYKDTISDKTMANSLIIRGWVGQPGRSWSEPIINISQDGITTLNKLKIDNQINSCDFII